MRQNALETVLGSVVVLVAIFFVVFAFTSADLRAVDGYELNARFLRAGGLEPGADVRISGVKVGTVTERDLDVDTFEAVITISVSPKVRLPADTEAVITGEGFLGGKYLRLIPGQENETVQPGGTLTNTRDFKSLEDSVSEIIFLATGGDD